MTSLPRGVHFGHLTDISDELFSLLFSHGLSWPEFNSRGRNNRRMTQFNLIFGEIPSEYYFLQEIVNKMISKLNEIHNENVIPINMVMNFYENGNFSTGMHRHSCRSMTVSIGDDRIFKVNTKQVSMNNGDFIVINGHNHGVPKMENKNARISLNLFYCLKNDTDVSINYIKK